MAALGAPWCACDPEVAARACGAAAIAPAAVITGTARLTRWVAFRTWEGRLCRPRREFLLLLRCETEPTTCLYDGSVPSYSAYRASRRA